jgi:putative transposase
MVDFFRRCYGSSYIAADLAKWLDGQNMEHVRGAPYDPMTQGKIERWHQTLKNRIFLENYYLPGDLEAKIDAFVDHYNYRRYHESLSNLIPADAFWTRPKDLNETQSEIAACNPKKTPHKSAVR